MSRGKYRQLLCLLVVTAACRLVAASEFAFTQESREPLPVPQGVTLGLDFSIQPNWPAPLDVAVRWQEPLPSPGVVPPPEIVAPETPAPGVAFGEPLPSLEEELWLHGGSHLYAPEGDRLDPFGELDEHDDFLRLPEDWQAPQPVTGRRKFLGADPVEAKPGPGRGFPWEPRFVGHGGYELFSALLEDGERRQDGLGHQLILDLDLRVTGTERMHVQFRPVGREDSGGSFFRLNDPANYDDNSTLIPDRWWIEGEIASIFSGWIRDPFVPRDYQVVLGKFPFLLHNRLLLNDEVIGIVVNKNTLLVGATSNLNVQTFLAVDDVDAFADASADVWGMHLTADRRHVFYEVTYAYLNHGHVGARDASYFAGSATRFFGTLTLAGRALFKVGDSAGRGDGQLFVVESNLTRYFSEGPLLACGFDKGVFYVNTFRATKGWNSISGGNFDRLRSSFEVDPLVAVSMSRAPDDVYGAVLGVQLFRHHDDMSLIPEVAYEEVAGEAVFGAGLRWMQKLGPRTYLDLRGIINTSDDPRLRREGLFASTTILF